VATQPADTDIRPISHTSTNDKVFSLVLPHLRAGARIVDVGAGEGYFSKMVGDRLQTEKGLAPESVLAACDLFPEFFRYSGIRCDPINPDGSLPYPDASFDVACSLEVIEHIKDQFAFARELHRIVKPGGVAIVSTPNVLNLNSRVRYLHSGFTVLFDPLPLSSDDPRHTAGHINPVHMGVVLIATLAFGLITPPYGLVLLMASKFVGVRFSQALRAALPIYAVFLITIVFIIFFPEVVLWIPKHVLPQSVGCFHNPSGAGFICPNG